jgi:hypothetical protein
MTPTVQPTIAITIGDPVGIGSRGHRQALADPALLPIVVHVTPYCSLRQGCEPNVQRILRTLQLGHESLQLLGFESPRIAVCGLNPPAGENSILSHARASASNHQSACRRFQCSSAERHCLRLTRRTLAGRTRRPTRFGRMTTIRPHAISQMSDPFFRTSRGRPDGSAVDADAYLWNTRYSGGCIVGVAPNGQIDRVVEMPVQNTTTCIFGGPTEKPSTPPQRRPERQQATDWLADFTRFRLQLAGCPRTDFGCSVPKPEAYKCGSRQTGELTSIKFFHERTRNARKERIFQGSVFSDPHFMGDEFASEDKRDQRTVRHHA